MAEWQPFETFYNADRRLAFKILVRYGVDSDARERPGRVQLDFHTSPNIASVSAYHSAPDSSVCAALLTEL